MASFSLLYNIYMKSLKITNWIVEMICTEMNIAIAITTNKENVDEIKELNKLNKLFFKFDCDKYGFKPF